MSEGLFGLLYPLMRLFAGALAFSFLASWVVKFFYRRAVEREMRKGSRKDSADGGEAFEQPVLPGLRPSEVPVEGKGPSDALRTSERAARAFRRAVRARRRAALNYASAGFLHALAQTLIVIYLVEPWGVSTFPSRLLPAALLVFLWPVAWTIADVLGADWRGRLAGAVVYGVALVLLGLPGQEPLVLWAAYMAFPTLARAGLANQWLKAVGTAVMVFTFVLSMGFLLAEVVGERLSEWEFFRYALAPGFLLGSLVVACLVMIFMGWYHERRYASDQTVLIDTHTLLATEWAAIACIGLTGGNRWLVFVPLFGAALALNWLVTYALFRFWNPVQEGRREGATLLLLRVFEPRGLPWWRRRLRRVFRTGERLLEGVGLHWRYAGSIQLITGTDVAAATLEVDELIEFATGRLDRRVVKDERDLARLFEARAVGPDRDGRFRVNEFVCNDDTWRETVGKLFADARAVLVDLRGFAPEAGGAGPDAGASAARGAAKTKPRGVVYELYQLLNLVPAGKLLLVTDATTDEAHLRSTLQNGWRKMEPRSPNCVPRADALRVLRINRPRPSEVRRVVRLLFEAAYGPAGGPAARDESL